MSWLLVWQKRDTTCLHPLILLHFSSYNQLLPPVLVSVPQRKRMDRTYLDTCKRRFVIGFGSHSYGGQEVSWFSICEQENQESWWCNSVQGQSPEKQGTAGVGSNLSPKAQEPEAPMSEGRRRWMAQIDQKGICPPSTLLFYSSPQLIGWCPTHWWGQVSVYWFKFNLFQRHPHRYTKK